MIRNLLIFLVWGAALSAYGQSSRHQVGVSSSYLVELFPDKYYYRACTFQTGYRYVFGAGRWCEFQVVGQLSAARTRYSATAFPTEDYPTGMELGVQAGVLWNIYLYKEYVSVYAGGFIGPVYTPNMPARQGGVINFSDNLCAGVRVRLTPYLFAEVQGVFRHLSNAGLAWPNYGINSYGGGVGLFYRLF